MHGYKSSSNSPGGISGGFLLLVKIKSRIIISKSASKNMFVFIVLKHI